MNEIKATAKIFCDTCKCEMDVVKTIKVVSKFFAMEEAKEKIYRWEKSLMRKNCKRCREIKDSGELNV